VDLIQDDTVAYTCRKNFSAFAFPAGAFYEISDVKIESAFESIFVDQIIHCIQFKLLDGVLKSTTIRRADGLNFSAQAEKGKSTSVL
jgi:hypothetical protein